ncbi:MAG: nitroreductase family protein, partial [Planctomycetota bacterium]|nr:nitroreductase family protein [Planctomycetota bacterium]
AAVRAKLKAAAWNQPQVTEASHVVVFCRLLNPSAADVDAYMARIAEVRGVPVSSLDGFRNMVAGYVENPPPHVRDLSLWSARQVYLALGFLLSAAANMGIDACPMEGFDPGAFDEILGLKGGRYASTVMATVGYRDGSDSYAGLKKVRMPESVLIERR